MAAGQKRVRRKPKQTRSQHRVDDILTSALDLVGKKGLAALTMREIARASDMPLSSVYQYFPNKSAVIAMLYHTFSQETRAHISSTLAEVSRMEDILNVACLIVDDYYARLSATPATQHLLNAIQADKTLQDMDIDETRAQASLFIKETEELIAEPLRGQYARAVHLLFQLAGSAVRLAVMAGQDEGALILEDFKNLIRAQLAPFDG